MPPSATSSAPGNSDELSEQKDTADEATGLESSSQWAGLWWAAAVRFWPQGLPFLSEMGQP